jgi:hypothetical protein
MPKTAVKQKSRQKPNPFQKAGLVRPADDDVDMHNAAETVREKDEAEEKLERLLFGDDDGFTGALKSQNARGLVALGRESDESDADDDHDSEEDDVEGKDLDDVDDADVCGAFSSVNCSDQANSRSCSSLTRAPVPFRQTPPNRQRQRHRPRPRATMTGRRRCGTTATTSA